MNFGIFSVVFVIVIFYQNIPIGSALMCYQCDEIIGQNIGCYKLNANGVLKENCSSTYVCLKYIQLEENATFIRRSCAPHTKCEELRAVAAGERNPIKHCSTCNSTFCNSGREVSFSFSLTALSSILYVVVKPLF
ncbi:hypothetical protein JTB14_036835 [Gonioctena quinquepunctata]|nr:hypothetical protein JTB14_036835 [Gonioctena quinquepunctata]